VFLGSFYPWTLFFIIETPKRHFLAQNHAFWSLIGRDRSYGVIWTPGEEYSLQKNKEPKVSQNSPFSQTPFPSSKINQILAWWVVSRISFLLLSFRKIGWKCGSSGGRIFGFSINLAHRLYNSLLLPHKPWYPKSKSGAFFFPFLAQSLRALPASSFIRLFSFAVSPTFLFCALSLFPFAVDCRVKNRKKTLLRVWIAQWKWRGGGWPTPEQNFSLFVTGHKVQVER